MVVNDVTVVKLSDKAAKDAGGDPALMGEKPVPERGFLTATVLLAVFAYAGAFFGWSPLEMILQDEGQFNELCPVGQANCADRTNAYDSLFVLCTTMFGFSSAVAGTLTDAFGPMISTGIGGILTVVGTSLLAISGSTSPLGGQCLQLSFGVLLPAGGALLFMGSYTAGFLYADPAPVLTAVSSLFDSSTLIYPVFGTLYSEAGFSRKELFIGYSGFGLLLFPLMAFGWWLNRHALAKASGGDDNPVEEVGKGVPLMLQPFRTAVKSFEFVFIATFFTVHVVRSNAFITVQNQALIALGDQGTYQHIFGYALPLGAIFVPVINKMHSTFGIAGSLQAVNIWGAVVTVISMTPILPLHGLNGLIYTGYRAALFSTNAAFCATTFGPKNMGKVMGGIALLGAIINTSQDPLLQWSLRQFGDDFAAYRSFNAIMLTTIIPLIPMNCIIIRRSEAAQKARVQKSTPARASPYKFGKEVRIEDLPEAERAERLEAAYARLGLRAEDLKASKVPLPDGHLLLGATKKAILRLSLRIGVVAEKNLIDIYVQGDAFSQERGLVVKDLLQLEMHGTHEQFYSRASFFDDESRRKGTPQHDWITEAHTKRYGSQMLGHDFCCAMQSYLRRNKLEAYSGVEIMLIENWEECGVAEEFLSHIRTQKLDETLQFSRPDAIPEDRKMWLDYICLRPCASDYDPMHMSTCIRRIGTTCAVLDPDLDYFKQLSCIFEMAESRDRLRFVPTLHAILNSGIKQCPKINSREAQAMSEEDKEKICGHIVKELGGFNEVNRHLESFIAKNFAL